MENKISIGVLAAELSKMSGKSKKISEDFLREFFRLASEIIVEGETLKIKGFGTFKLSDVESRTSVNVNTGEPHEIGPHKKVVFTPAKELSAAINSPFEAFESVEMEDDMPEEIFLDDMSDEEYSDEDRIENGVLEAGSMEEAEDDEITLEAYNIEEHKIEIEEEDKGEEQNNIPKEEMTQMVSSTPLQAADKTTMEEEVVLPVYDNYTPVKSRFGMGFLVGSLSTFAVCAVVFMLGCFLDWWPVNFGNPKAEQIARQIETPEPEVTVPAEEPALQIVAEPVYDTVSTTRYLTSIAREHYGNYNFWPYIYMENESILGHPDRITPGTKVIVPDLSKYGVDPKNKDDVAKAKQKAMEIYSRFK